MGFLDSIASPIGSLVSTIGNYFSTKSTNKANQNINNQNISFNKEQNELDRAFNAEEAQKSRDFNAEQSLLQFERESNFAKEMWDKENEYNTPANQLARLEAAGLNPNLFGGNNVAGSAPSVSASSATSTPASSHGLGAPSSIPMESYQIPDFGLISAQTKLLNAEAEKAKGDTDLAHEQAEDLRQLRQGKLDLQNVSIHLGLAQERLSDMEAKRSLKQCQEIDTSIKVANQSLLNAQQQPKNHIQIPYQS